MALDSENWIKLQNLAAIQNSSCTAIVDQLIDAYVNDKLPDNYEQRIQEQVYSVLDNKISDKLITAIALRVSAILEPKNTVKTVDTDKIDQPEKNPKKTKSKSKNVENEIVSIIPNTASAVDTVDIKEKNTALFTRHRAASNKKSHPDSYVAAQEGLARQTVRRYRKGERKPKPEFIEKWGLNWDGSAWCLN